MIALLTGFVAGVVHVFSGPDHWVAVAPLSVSKPKSALKFGARWGMGHGAGIVAMGVLGIWLRDAFPLDLVSTTAEFAVGVILVVTGIWAIKRSKLVVLHAHHHQHGAETHEHLHIHVPYDESAHQLDHGTHEHAASSIGLLHGIAGSGHFWGLIPALALEPEQAVIYLLAFVISSTLAMMLVSMGIGHMLRAKTDEFIRSSLKWTGALSCTVGGIWCLYCLS